jgi:hypothetical protein
MNEARCMHLVALYSLHYALRHMVGWQLVSLGFHNSVKHIQIVIWTVTYDSEYGAVMIYCCVQRQLVEAAAQGTCYWSQSVIRARHCAIVDNIVCHSVIRKVI